MAQYGLLGRNIDYSFSKDFFAKKFDQDGLKDTYQNIDLPNLDCLKDVLAKKGPFKGLNVTIPYKESIIPYLDSIDPEARVIGAVNTIKIKKNGHMTGFNTDHYGFAKSLEEWLPSLDKTALVLGTGGASKAIIYVLKALGFVVAQVSRSLSEHCMTYDDLNEKIMQQYQLIVNCTPLGTHPDTSAIPPIPYQFIDEQHVLYDLIYNPEKTEFLKLGQASKARIKNGRAMLEHQALKSWALWTSS